MENIFRTYNNDNEMNKESYGILKITPFPLGTEKLNNKEKNRYVGMCFVPMQEWEDLYDLETAFKTGTAFPSLNKPFMGAGR